MINENRTKKLRQNKQMYTHTPMRYDGLFKSIYLKSILDYHKFLKGILRGYIFGMFYFEHSPESNI